jgi:multiple sugar transport system permease protein
MKPSASRPVFSSSVLRTGLLYILVAVFLFWTLAPVYWLGVSAISPTAELAAYPPNWFPKNPTFERIRAITSGGMLDASIAQTMARPAEFFRKAIVNSLIVAGTTTILCLSLGSLAGYAFARLRFPGKRTLMILPLALQMVPPIALVIPLFMLVQGLGLTDSLAGLILIYPSFLLVYVIWVMTGYYQGLPRELEDAARVDGCSRLGVFTRIVLPLSRPALFSTGLLTFLLAWDEFLFALVLTTNRAKTMPVAIGEFSTQFGIDFGMMMSGGLLASLPPILIAILFQPLLVRGITAGSVKG